MEETQHLTDYSDTAFDSRKHQFSSYDKTDFKPSLLSLPRKNKINKKFLEERVTDYAFAGFLNNLHCSRKYYKNSQSLNLHRYHYDLDNCSYEGGGGLFIFIVAIVFILVGCIVFFIHPGSQTNLSLGNTIFIISSVLIFKLNLYYQSSLDPAVLILASKTGRNRFDRFTGMLVIKKENESIEIPFKELDAYCYLLSGANVSKYILFLAHRYSNNGFSTGSFSHYHAALGKLSYLIRFMDTSKPLPNLPILASDRDKDPISAQINDKSILTRGDWESMDNDDWIKQALKSGDKLKEIYGTS